MITIKNEEDIKYLREGGRHLCRIFNRIEKFIAPGITTKDIDDLAEKLTRSGGDIPILKGYHPTFAERPYPATTCISINDEIVHGIPKKDRVLKEGDIVGVDISISHNDLIVDSARTFPVGKIDKEAQRLISVTEEARALGIKAAKANGHVGDIGHAIESFVKEKGYVVVEELCGHGVGYAVHEEPNIPNFGTKGTGPKLVPGMVIAIEPMVNEKSKDVIHDHDGYTCRTKDGGRSAHFEHTVLITKNGPEVLTTC